MKPSKKWPHFFTSSCWVREGQESFHTQMSKETGKDEIDSGRIEVKHKRNSFNDDWSILYLNLVFWKRNM